MLTCTVITCTCKYKLTARVPCRSISKAFSKYAMYLNAGEGERDGVFRLQRYAACKRMLPMCANRFVFIFFL